MLTQTRRNDVAKYYAPRGMLCLILLVVALCVSCAKSPAPAEDSGVGGTVNDDSFEQWARREAPDVLDALFAIHDSCDLNAHTFDCSRYLTAVNTLVVAGEAQSTRAINTYLKAAQNLPRGRTRELGMDASRAVLLAACLWTRAETSTGQWPYVWARGNQLAHAAEYQWFPIFLVEDVPFLYSSGIEPDGPQLDWAALFEEHRVSGRFREAQLRPALDPREAAALLASADYMARLMSEDDAPRRWNEESLQLYCAQANRALGSLARHAGKVEWSDKQCRFVAANTDSRD